MSKLERDERGVDWMLVLCRSGSGLRPPVCAAIGQCQADGRWGEGLAAPVVSRRPKGRHPDLRPHCEWELAGWAGW